MPLPLETARLILRPFQLSDAPAFSAYRSDPEVARYQGWEAPYSLEKALDYCTYLQEAGEEKPGEWLRLAMAPKAGGDIIGDIGAMLLVADPRQAELGITLSRPAQGQGYGQEAMAALINYLFKERGLYRLRANIDPANDASARLLQRMGFRHEGRWIDSLWFKGAYASEDWYAILQREWTR